MKANRFLHVLAVVALLTAAMVSCKKPKEVTGVELNKTELTLVVGDTETLIATVLPEDAENKVVNWKSNDRLVATVSNGIITAKAAGTALITVTTADGNKTTSCTVTVKPFKEPEMVFVEGNDSIGSFYIGKYPVTQKLWKDASEAPYNQLNYNEGDNYPAHYIHVSWALSFIQDLNLATGKNYRLPSYVEWDYAAKGGNKSKGYEYSGSNNIDEVAWYAGNSNNSVHPVGTKLPNELGIYDMSGNVWEWVVYFYSTGPMGNGYRLYGGSYCSSADNCRALSYYSGGGNGYEKDFGFRLVLEANNKSVIKNKK